MNCVDICFLHFCSLFSINRIGIEQTLYSWFQVGFMSWDCSLRKESSPGERAVSGPVLPKGKAAPSRPGVTCSESLQGCRGHHRAAEWSRWPFFSLSCSTAPSSEWPGNISAPGLRAWKWRFLVKRGGACDEGMSILTVCPSEAGWSSMAYGRWMGKRGRWTQYGHSTTCGQMNSPCADITVLTFIGVNATHKPDFSQPLFFMTSLWRLIFITSDQNFAHFIFSAFSGITWFLAFPLFFRCRKAQCFKKSHTLKFRNRTCTVEQIDPAARDGEPANRCSCRVPLAFGCGTAVAWVIQLTKEHV